LTEAELLEVVYASDIFHSPIAPGMSIDQVGTTYLPQAIDGPRSYFSWPDYWERLKSEFCLLVCTKHRKYAALRRRLAATASTSQTAVVSTISVAMAAQFGTTFGVLVPFIAMCLIAFVRIGQEAFCAEREWKMELGSSPDSKSAARKDKRGQ
jgi:hypothetical protein